MRGYSVIGYVEKTGHYYKRLHMETCEKTNDCTTCDQSCCDTCEDIYVVENIFTDKILYKGTNKEEAIEIAKYDFINEGKK